MNIQFICMENDYENVLCEILVYVDNELELGSEEGD